ncbi:nucleotidyl transferase AbiEii/AbiGii toxin family protein [Longimicrobium sp.]|uniref:nucleotidyl transferase AbiEii/AbiGii toxin family protein n=1 Tax=Longimicrobium sp. TaxID=2029185 RepID=UPI002BFC8557|nr:nucleotidyl transferase AbiEii/AbiGii toxin family protein [Longimicrobium sp.]HSU17637.1 nucleotidyl transferase AbiEii/AbiGii toxin family protein [Longimicrobium sp.]
MVADLDRAGVRFVLIGGLAGIVHGSPRMTNDVDICYDRAPENLARLAGLLASWNAFPRDFPRDDLPWCMDAQTLRMATILTLKTNRGFIDIFAEVPGVGDYAACDAMAETADFGGREIRVLGLRGLIAAKRVADRTLDRADILTYQKILELRGEQP